MYGNHFFSVHLPTSAYDPSGHCAECASRCKIRRRSTENECADALEKLNNMFETEGVVFIAEDGYGAGGEA